MIWLASYPKSGNTWIRTIIQEMIAPGVAPTSAIPSLIKAFPSDAPVYDVLGTRARIVKTHCHTGHKRLRRNADQTMGVITIHRHPLDVLLSYLNFSSVKKTAENFKDGIVKPVNEIVSSGEIDHYVDQFIELGGCKEYSKICGPWPEFYTSWSYMSPESAHLHLRYEDMIADPVIAIERIRSYLQIPHIDIPKLMSDVEQKTSLDGRFFWRKKAYNFRELIPQNTIDRFERHFAGALDRLGYRASEKAAIKVPAP